MSITNCDEFYLKKYKNYIDIIVNKFIAKGKGNSFSIKDDLLQEAQLALLRWIKRRDGRPFDISDSNIFIYKHLYTCVRRNTGVHMRNHKLKEFCEKYKIMPIEDFDNPVDSLNDIDYAIDFNRWRRNLPPREKAILSLKIAGYNESTMSRIIGISQQVISYILNTSIRNSYNAYFHPEQNPTPTQKRKSKSTPTAA